MASYPILLSLEEEGNGSCSARRRWGVNLFRWKVSRRPRVLAEDVSPRKTFRPFPRSPYDGYALRAEDTREASREAGVTLRIVEEIPAGHAPQKALTAGCAAKILTGAPIPFGADAVVKFEDTTFDAQTVTVYTPCRSW